MLAELVGALQLLRGYGVHLGDLTAVLARRYGDRHAVDDGARTPGLRSRVTTFEEVDDAVAALAAAHRAAGVGQGSVVLLLLGNRLDIVLHAAAIARLGGVAAPVNPRLGAGELDAVAAAVAATDAVVDPDVASRLRDEASLTGLPWRLTHGDDGDDLAGWLEDHPGERVGEADRDPEETVVVLTTSGTTGTPKAARLTSHGLLSGVGRLAMAPVGWRSGPRAGRDLLVAALPLTHVMGFSVVLATLCAGIPLLHRPRFDAAEILDLIEERRPNVFVGVPTMYADLEAAGAAQRDLTSIQLWVSAADVMPASRARRFQQYGAAARVGRRRVGTAAFVDVYGMVELSGPAAVRIFPPSLVRPLPAPPLAVALPGVEIRAVDEHGRPVAWGQVGELQVRGPGVLRGYGGEHEAVDASGWFATGDLGRTWPGDTFSFAGRGRDRLKVGGFSVFPAEVETELRAHPGVADVALVGLPDERTGERPVALVIPADDGFDAEEFLAWAAARVAGYRRPQAVHVVDALPRGAHAKVDREAATRLAAELAHA